MALGTNRSREVDVVIGALVLSLLLVHDLGYHIG